MAKSRSIPDASGYNTSYSVDCPFDCITDETDPNDYFEGWCDPNGDTDDYVWKIRRTKVTSTGTIRRWAGGTSKMVKQWTARADYSYKGINA